MLDGSETLVPVTSETPLPSPPKKKRRGIALVLIGVLAVAMVVTVWGVLGRERSEAKLADWTHEQAVPTVSVLTPQIATKGRELTLPGDVEAFYEASIYARVSGYLKMWYQDIGAHVKAGQLLADIDTPELDQQLEQAKSDVASVQAGASLANLTAKRWKALLSSQAVSQQTADEKTGDAVEKKALVAAAQANVDRLSAMEGFKRITAPFDGIVTSRRTDIGALINAGGGTGAELFKVADLHEMRIYVQVPQSYSADVHPGMRATLKLSQYPSETFAATVATTSNAISKDSRTVLVELMANNTEGRLWPGTFAEVHFDFPPDPHIYTLPSSALLFREHGLSVATIGSDGRVVLKPITVGRDLGTEVEVSSGVKPGERVIDNPSDSLSAGDKVKVSANAAATNETLTPPAGADE